MYRIRWKRIFILILVITAFVIYKKYKASGFSGSIENKQQIHNLATVKQTTFKHNYNLTTINS